MAEASLRRDVLILADATAVLMIIVGVFSERS
jgi:hypothetical protein